MTTNLASPQPTAAASLRFGVGTDVVLVAEGVSAAQAAAPLRHHSPESDQLHEKVSPQLTAAAPLRHDWDHECGCRPHGVSVAPGCGTITASTRACSTASSTPSPAAGGCGTIEASRLPTTRLAPTRCLRSRRCGTIAAWCHFRSSEPYRQSSPQLMAAAPSRCDLSTERVGQPSASLQPQLRLHCGSSTSR